MKKKTARGQKTSGLYEQIQKLKKSSPALSRDQVCKKLKVSINQYMYATAKGNRNLGIDGRKSKSTELATVPRAARMHTTVMDLSTMSERLPDMGRNTPAIVVMTDAYTAFSWMSSMMKG